MKIVFSDRTLKELEVMDHGLRKLFVKHAEKVSLNPQKRHLRFGLLFNVEEVTKQARMVFQIEKETCLILHCFKHHKEYERWFKSFK